MKDKIIRFSVLILAAISLAVSVSPQTAAAGETLYTKNAYGEFVEVTNTPSGPFLSGPAVEIFQKLATATNWGVATFGIMKPASHGEKAKFGGGAVFLYNFNPYMGAGLGIDYLDRNVTMPSAQLQLQAPLYIGGTNGVCTTLFGFTGIATPVGGEGVDNGTAVGLFGAGLDVKVWKGLGAFYAIEQRTGQDAPWHLLGVRYAKRF